MLLFKKTIFKSDTTESYEVFAVTQTSIKATISDMYQANKNKNSDL